MMTNEQKKVLTRCRAMIKRAFPSMTGKFIFKLRREIPSIGGVKIDMFMPELKLDTDVDMGSEVNVVNIH